MDKIKETLLQFINECSADNKLENLDTNVNLIYDFGLDSVRIIMLLSKIENEFEITIDSTDMDYEYLKYTDNLIEFVTNKLNDKE